MLGCISSSQFSLLGLRSTPTGSETCDCTVPAYICYRPLAGFPTLAASWWPATDCMALLPCLHGSLAGHQKERNPCFRCLLNCQSTSAVTKRPSSYTNPNLALFLPPCNYNSCSYKLCLSTVTKQYNHV